MLANTKGRLVIPTLTSVLLGCLAMPAQGDELDYLPNGTLFVLSAKFPDALKSKVFDEFKKTLKEIGRRPVDFEAEMSQRWGVPTGNIARFTLGAAFQRNQPDRPVDEIIGILTITRPTTPAAIIAGKKTKDLTFSSKEIKVGSFTIHETHYQLNAAPKDKPGPLQQGGAFCIVDDKTVLLSDGGAEVLRNVLLRNKKPVLSANLQAGLKHAGINNTAFAVMDIAALPARERDDLFSFLRRYRPAGLKDVAGKPHTFVATLNLQEKLSAATTIFYSDAAGAAEFRKIAETALVDLKTNFRGEGKVAQVLNGARVSAKGNQVSIEATSDAAAAMELIAALSFDFKW